MILRKPPHRSFWTLCICPSTSANSKARISRPHLTYVKVLASWEDRRRMKKDEEGCSVLNVVTLCSSSERPRVHHGVQHGRLDFEAASKCQRMFDSDNLIALHSLHSLIDSYILHIIDIHCMKLIQSFSKITSRITVGQLAALFQRVYAAEMNLVLWWTRRGHLVGPWCSEAYERLL